MHLSADGFKHTRGIFDVLNPHAGIARLREPSYSVRVDR